MPKPNSSQLGMQPQTITESQMEFGGVNLVPTAVVINFK
jgi:hypothetical protein